MQGKRREGNINRNGKKSKDGSADLQRKQQETDEREKLDKCLSVAEIKSVAKQTKKRSNSRQEEEGGCHEIRDDHGRVGYSRSVRRAPRHHSPPYSERKFYASEDPISSPEVSHVRHQRRKQEVDSLQGEVRNIKPPSFEGEKKEKMMSKHGFLGSGDIFSCITIRPPWKLGFPPTIYTGNLQCGGTN
jgi:hypothetical protein